MGETGQMNWSWLLKKLTATRSVSVTSQSCCNALISIVCVPTPIDGDKKPDLGH